MRQITSDVVWAVILAVGLVYELVAVALRRWPDTLSAKTRRFFRTDHPVGRGVFIVTWGGFSLWFLWHIVWQ